MSIKGTTKVITLTSPSRPSKDKTLKVTIIEFRKILITPRK